MMHILGPASPLSSLMSNVRADLAMFCAALACSDARPRRTQSARHPFNPYHCGTALQSLALHGKAGWNRFAASMSDPVRWKTDRPLNASRDPDTTQLQPINQQARLHAR